MTVLTSKIICPVKINLTLRVLSLREDGYHDIFSLFMKKIGLEELTIHPLSTENIKDRLKVKGVEIHGRNIINDVLESVREGGAKIPPFDIELIKKFPTGSGIGAGSGNAAALINYLERAFSLSFGLQRTAAIGADVAFLALDERTAIVRGKGEIIEPFREVPDFPAALLFPKWKSNTASAYKALDEMRAGGYIAIPSAESCAAETVSVMEKLAAGERAGLLPNDFCAIFGDREDEYNSAYETAEECGALAWGLCGSGSAAFALCPDEETASMICEEFKRYNWTNKAEILR